MTNPNKSLGQHWLKDREVLQLIASYADINSEDAVLEIGPGLGTLTSILLAQAKQVVAVEFDAALAAKLPAQFPGTSLTVKSEDILSFDLHALPPDYKVVANVPYYITSKIVQLLSESPNPPILTVLLVQKEVAERLAAGPGSMSTLSIAAQLYHEVDLGAVVPAKLFTPPPKVDSQVVILKRRGQRLFEDIETDSYFRVVKAGFSERRKKLRSSLAGGLRLSKTETDELLRAATIDPEVRAQELSLEEWARLVRVCE